MAKGLNGWHRLGIVASVLWVVGWGVAGTVNADREIQNGFSLVHSEHMSCHRFVDDSHAGITGDWDQRTADCEKQARAGIERVARTYPHRSLRGA
jgi:hypothetical protein